MGTEEFTINTEEVPVITLQNISPSYDITFHRDGEQVGRLDFNGPEMIFEGQAGASAIVFFDWIKQQFALRLESERKEERERIAAHFEATPGREVFGDAIADEIRGMPMCSNVI